MRIAVVTHGPASSKFWAIIRNGVDSAARRLDVLVDYKSPDVYSLERMSALIDQAVATKPDGLVVSIPEPGLAPAIRRAVKAGIPVVSINSGSNLFKYLGVLAHVGQVEDRAGLEAGRRLAKAGVRRRAVHQPAGRQHRARRALPRARAGDARGRRERARALDRGRLDPPRPGRIARAVKDFDADGALATNSLGGLAAAKAAGRTSRSARSTSARTCSRRSRRGRIDFAVDQQAYLQGYLPIEMLALRARYGIFPSEGDVVATGPHFVTRDDAAQALELSERSIR